MAGVNRYTQLSTTKFNPLSMEEMSIVPMAMRQKHDAANAELEKRRLEMNAAIDALPQHSERATALVNEMNNLIDTESQNLAKSGYTHMTGSNIIKMNRDYQNLMSPNGELGRILSAKKDYAEKYKQYVEDGQKRGWGLDRIQNAWNNHVRDYYGYDEQGKVTNIGAIGAPEKYELSDALKTYAPLVGQIKRRLDTAGGGRLAAGPDGTVAIYNKDGSRHQLTNMPQLQQLNAMLRSDFLTPGGRGFESARYAGKNLSSLRDEIDMVVGMMTKDEITDTTNTKLSLHNLPKKAGDGDGDGLGGGINDVVNVGGETGRIGSEYLKSYDSTLSKINQLKDNRDITLAESFELASLKQAQDAHKAILRNNPEHANLRAQYDQRIKELQAKGVTSRPIMGQNPYSTKNVKTIIGRDYSVGSDPEIQRITKEMKAIEKASWNPNLIDSARYTLAPTTAENKRKIEALSWTFAQAFSSGNTGLFNTPGVDVSAIDINGNRRTGRHADRTDKERLGELVYKASSIDPKNVEFKAISAVGSSGMAEYEVSVKVPANVKAAFDRTFRLGETGQGDVKEGDIVKFKMVAKNTKDNAAINNIFGQTVNTIASSGPNGKALAESMVYNTSKANLTYNLGQKGITYNDFKKQPLQYAGSKEDAIRAQNMLQDSAIDFQIESGYFDINNMNPNNPKDRNKAILDFYETHGDNPINTF